MALATGLGDFIAVLTVLKEACRFWSQLLFNVKLLTTLATHSLIWTFTHRLPGAALYTWYKSLSKGYFDMNHQP